VETETAGLRSVRASPPLGLLGGFVDLLEVAVQPVQEVVGLLDGEEVPVAGGHVQEVGGGAEVAQTANGSRAFPSSSGASS